ncbi:MAG: TadE family protein [Chloroflexota bacterium]
MLSSRTKGAHRRGQSGQALLELALVAPILILILAGLVQFALIFETQIGINNAVREAARRGASLTTPDGATAQANANWTLTELQSVLGNSQTHDPSRDKLEVCFFTPAQPLDASGKAQVMVRITASYSHPLFLPLVNLILDGIDGVPDNSLAAGYTTQFHVEQTTDTNIGEGAFARNYVDPVDPLTPCAR